jgi:hypothetical protein
MRRLVVRLVVSLLIAAALLAATLRGMAHDAAAHLGDVSLFDAIVAALAQTPIGVVVVYALSFVAVHVARVWRWVLLVRPLGATDTREVVAVCAVGFAAIILFPLRLGEMVRPYLLSRRAGVPFTAALGTAVVERVLDGLIITALLFAAVATSPQPASETVRGAGWVSLAIFSGATLVLGLFAAAPAAAERLLTMTVGRIAPGPAAAIARLATTFLRGVSTLREGGQLVTFLALTVVYWSLNAVGMWWLARGYGLEVPLLGGFGLLATLVVGLMVPSGPGYLGNFQFFMIEGLRLYVPAAALGATGLALSLVQNAVQFVVQVAFGLPFLVRLGLTPARLARLAGEAGPRERDVA